MKQVSTAEQFLRFKSNISEDKTSVEYLTDCEVEEIMIEFAKLHVKAALEAANKNARIDVNGNKVIASGFRDRDGNQVSISIDKHSITNAYPESNIK
jgi:hypothetical protein